MAVTPDDAETAGEQDTGAARAPEQFDLTQDPGLPTVFQTAEWIPEAYRQAYLDGVASVLGRESLIEP